MSEKWKPGQSGNPDGRPKGTIGYKRLIYEKAAELHPRGCRNKTNAEIVLEQIFKAAAGRPSKLQMQAGTYLYDHLAGKAVQAVANLDARPENREQLIESLLNAAKT